MQDTAYRAEKMHTLKHDIGAPRALRILSAFVGAGVLASAINPFDRMTWLLELSPLPVIFGVLWFTCRRFPLTTLLYFGIAVQCLGLVIGAAYTFPLVPLGGWLADLLDLSRNPYDRLGHLVQGFVPALAVREVLVRRLKLRGDRVMPFLVVCVVMTFSASYEIVEWLVAITLGAEANDFLGMQGDPWDAQADMLCAFFGAVCMLCFLPRWHDWQITALSSFSRHSEVTPSPVMHQ